jgi:hypothetical protein
MRRVGLLLGLVVAMATTPAASRADDANHACDDGDGVTIVVDFGSLGGGVNVRCGAQPIKNGFDVFRHANVSYETVSGSEFVCRIAGKPGPQSEDCTNTPPGDAYWTYWYAKPGGEWKYSNLGPGSRKPPPGSYDGWVFNSGEPRHAPGYPPPPAPATTTTAAPASTPGPADTTPGPGASPVITRAPSAAPLASTTTTQPSATTVTTELALGVEPATTTSSIALGSVDLSVGSGDGGTSAGFIGSVVVLGGLGALGFAFLRRRGR